MQTAAVQNGVGLTLTALRAGHANWAATSIRDRLAVVGRVRGLLAANAEALCSLFPPELQRRNAESLTNEIIPLAEACGFLQKRATRLLRPRRMSAVGRPVWLKHTEVEIRREPFGVVLILGAANYPLFLAAVQTLQALTAGNVVLLKPGRGATPVLQRFAALLQEAGLPADALAILDEDVEAAQEAIDAGVDKIVLTGSVSSGRAVLRQAAERLTPTVMELSGEDPVIVLASADLERAARAIAFGLRLNDGNTCIAPRRLLVDASVAVRLKPLLPQDAPDVHLFSTEGEAVLMARRSAFALGATVFGAESEARRVAAKIRAGVVVINDMIVPTADPRVSFGGMGQSGFGKTRGEEGLLEMTVSKAVVLQRARRLRHLAALPERAEQIFLGYLSMAHAGTWRERMGGLKRLCGGARQNRFTSQRRSNVE